MPGMSADQEQPGRSAWQAALDFGIDVTLLEANLKRTPAERLRELVAMNRFQDELQARTVPAEQRRRNDMANLRAKFGSLLDEHPPGTAPR
jgi:hypothetical protein